MSKVRIADSQAGEREVRKGVSTLSQIETLEVEENRLEQKSEGESNKVMEERIKDKRRGAK